MIDSANAPACDPSSLPQADLSPTWSNEALLAWVKAHYFTSEEVAEARHIMEECGYEEAIAYLARVGQDSLRRSETRPVVYLTIPGGKLFLYHPGRPEGSMTRAFSFGIGEFARLVFPLPPGADPLPSRSSPSHEGMLPLWDEGEGAVAPASTSNTPPPVNAPTRTRPKKLKYDAQTVRVGFGTSWREKPGWVVRDHGLAYVLEPGHRGGYEVSIVHVRSRRAMACFFIPQGDELAHIRLRQLMEELVPLTDWNQGITALLREKQGERKQAQWERQILDLWSEQERHALFALCDQQEEV